METTYCFKNAQNGAELRQFREIGENCAGTGHECGHGAASGLWAHFASDRALERDRRNLLEISFVFAMLTLVLLKI